MLRLTLAILIALFAGLVLGADASKMYIVDDDGFAQYHSISEAVAAANDGDTIYVKPGTYREHIVLNKSVVLMPPRGEEGIVNLAGEGSDIGIEVLADGCKIEGLTISDFAGPGIYVESEGNEIRKNVFVDNVHGIFLNGTSGNVIENNQQQGGYCGIVLLSSSGNIVTGNVAKDCIGSTEFPGAGILLYSASKNAISGCLADGCARGFRLVSGSSQNDLSGNSMVGCRYGLLVEMASEANSVRGFSIENSTTAIALDGVSKNQIQNNVISNSTNFGITIFSSTENSFVENSLVGIETGIMVSENSEGNVFTDNGIETASSGIVITDSSANRLERNHLVGVRLGLSVDGTAEESFNNQIPESNTIDGKPILYLYDRSGEEFSGEYGHVTLASCENCIVRESSVTNDALFVYLSRGCKILDNVVSNGYGMLIRGSDENEITGNEACDNRYGGIMLVESDKNLIGENTASRNERDGLLLRESNFNKVLSNAVEENEETGIRVFSSNETEITGNSVIGNGVGIDLSQSAGCIIYRNNLIENIVQAEDDGANLWDWGALKGGNYWSDHSCQGSPCQGTARAIGNATADYYPFGERDGWA
jgi:parallel beta-helix repeat protein